MTKCSGHQPKNPKLNKIQAACFLLILWKVAFSSSGGDWLNQSWEHGQDSLFQDQLLTKDSYLLLLSTYRLKFSKACLIVTNMYQILSLCSAMQLNAKNLLPELEDFAQPALHACKKSNSPTINFYTVFSLVHLLPMLFLISQTSRCFLQHFWVTWSA